jgi:HD-like signal output (HDOD) protein/ActR/RegA family two-component response regulator
MQKLLFVDDEPLVLQGLRRSLHTMSRDWNMTFVESGDEALQVLDREPYDVIITDMRMPKMDGAQLLEEVKRRHPAMVRMVLSGQSSREAVLRSLSPTHQYMSKPCDPQDLKIKLAQAFAMRDLLENPKLKALVSGLKSIPSLPAVYDELMQELQSEDSSTARVGTIIAKDAGMTAKILQIANSAFLGLRCHISNPAQAVCMIGMDMVRALVVSVHVFSQFEAKPSVSSRWEDLWEHSVAVASLSKRIAAAQKSIKVVLEDSFTAGLLHDVGKIILLAEMPAEYADILNRLVDRSLSLAELERDKIGCTHADVGAYLIGIWGLPHTLTQAVGFHDRPGLVVENRFSPLTATHVADAIVSEKHCSATTQDVALDRAYLAGLGIGDREAAWRELYEEEIRQKSARGGV